MVNGIEPRRLQPSIRIIVNRGADSLRITKKLHYMDLSNLSEFKKNKNSVRLFVGSAWSFGFFIPATTANDLRLRRISISYSSHYFLILILEKEPVFPFSMLSAKQGNYWYHFYNVFHGIGHWTSRTRSQHSTTRLSRRHLSDVIIYAGGNDGLNGTPPRKTKANIEVAIETTLEQGCNVWICLIAPRVD